MDSQQPQHFITLLGSLRRGSYHAEVARVLPSLAPAGVTVWALASVGELPHYNADLQAEGRGLSAGGAGDGGRRSNRPIGSSSSRRGITIPYRAR